MNKTSEATSVNGSLQSKTVSRKNSVWNGFVASVKGLNPIVKRIIIVVIALAVALIAELALFNMRSFINLKNKTTFDIKSESVVLDGFTYDEKNDYYYATKKGASVQFNDISSRVYSLSIIPAKADKTKIRYYRAEYTDGDSTRGIERFGVVRKYERSRYISLSTSGTVSSVKIIFDEDIPSGNVGARIQTVKINNDIPVAFNLTRFLLIFAAVALFSVICRKLREPFELGNSSQKAITVGVVVCVMIALCWIVTFQHQRGDTMTESAKTFFSLDHNQYSSEIVDALRKHQPYLDIQVDDSLRNAELAGAPIYDPAYRSANRIIGQWDHAYYNGHYYSYFGIVPAILLFLPFNVLTGAYLPLTVAMLIFVILSVLFAFMLWRQFCIRYIKRLSFGAYVFGALAVMFSTNAVYSLLDVNIYNVAIVSGQMFVLAGLYFLVLGAGAKTPKYKYLVITIGASCLALAVGCRPNLALVSVAVPIILWREVYDAFRGRKIKRGISTVCAAILPYIPVAIGLMYYNYVRFGSVLEFGSNYQITVSNVGASFDIGFLNVVRKTFLGIANYLFNIPVPKFVFPFVDLHGPFMAGYNGYIYSGPFIGVFALPICFAVFLLPFTWKRMRAADKSLPVLLVALMTAGIVIMVFSTMTAGMIYRYTSDFLWFYVLAGAVTACYAHNRISDAAQARATVADSTEIADANAKKTAFRVTNLTRRVLHVVLLFTFFAAFFCGFRELWGNGNNNPHIFYRIVDFFKFW